MAGEITLSASSSDDHIFRTVLVNRPISKIVVVDSKTVDYNINTVEEFNKVYQMLVEKTKTLLDDFLETRDPIAITVNYFVVLDSEQFTDPLLQTGSYFRKLLLIKQTVENLTEDIVTVCYKAVYEFPKVNPDVAKSVGLINNTLEIQQCKSISYKENILDVIAKVRQRSVRH